MPTQLQKIPKLAELLGITTSRAYNLANRKGFFPPGVIVRLGRQVRWNPEKLSEFLDQGGSLQVKEDSESQRDAQ